MKSKTLLVASLTLGAYFSILLGKDINYDYANYHAYIGYSILELRNGIDFQAVGQYIFFNPLLDIPIYLGRKFLIDWQFGALFGAYHGLIIYLLAKIYLFTTNTYSNNYTRAFLFAFMGFISPIAFSEVGTAFGDLTLAVLILSGVALVLKSFAGNNVKVLRTNPILIAGFLLGLAGGLKFPFLAFFLAMLITFLVYRRTLSVLNLLISGTLGFTVAYLGIGIQSILAGYNFFEPVTRGPLFALPGISISHNLAPRAFTPDSVGDFFGKLFNFDNSDGTMELSFRDPRIVIFLATIIVLLMARISKLITERETEDNQKTIFLGIFLFISVCLMTIFFGYPRYSIPNYLLSPIVIFLILEIILVRKHEISRLMNNWLALLMATVFFVPFVNYSLANPFLDYGKFAGVSGTYPNWGRVPWTNEKDLRNIIPPLEMANRNNIILTRETSYFFTKLNIKSKRALGLPTENGGEDLPDYYSRFDKELAKIKEVNTSILLLQTHRWDIQERLKRHRIEIGQCFDIPNPIPNGLQFCKVVFTDRSGTK
jgi:hypothetical protein